MLVEGLGLHVLRHDHPGVGDSLSRNARKGVG
jgi:hypothetical protein